MAAQYGTRLVPRVVDELAQIDPQRVFASFPIDSAYENGIRDITFFEFGRAVNRCAWWIHNHLGKSDNFDTISYLGSHDLAVFIMILAAIKTGYQLFVGAAPDSVETYLILHENLSCQYLLTPDEVPPKASELLLKRQMRHEKIPSLQHWLEPVDVEIYHYTKSYAEARQDPFVILTTSGSTGTPKPIIMTHGTMAHHDLFRNQPPLGAERITQSHFVGKRVFMGLPKYHSAAICFMVLAIYVNFTVVMPGTGRVTAAVANSAHVHANVQVSFVAPNVLTEMSRHPDYIENLQKLEYVTFGGASLPREVGNLLSRLVRLFVSFGATETGYYALRITEPEDWEYANPSPMMGCDFQDVGSGMYELHFKRDKSLEPYQGVFSTFPNKDDFTLNDIYSKHPTKEGFWLYEGRSDDLIVLESGWNINPLMPEAYIGSHPKITGILLTGYLRPKIAALIEPKTPVRSKQECSELLEELWAHIEQSNARFVEDGRIEKELIVFTSPEKPMVRAGKGTVRRKVTLNLYSDELDKAYDKFGKREKPY